MPSVGTCEAGSCGHPSFIHSKSKSILTFYSVAPRNRYPGVQIRLVKNQMGPLAGKLLLNHANRLGLKRYFDTEAALLH